MKFHVIGIDDNKQQFFSEKINELIRANRVFSGGARHYEIVKELLPADHLWIEIKIPLDLVFQQYEQHTKLVIFASGDPLFFGFANTIQRKMPDAKLEVYPYFNSLQLLAHKLLMPYQDMHIVSLTGRPWHKFDEALIQGYNKIGILTDKKEHTPSSIAQRMLEYGYENYSMSIGELLGNEEHERATTWEIKEVIGQTFAFPNNMILQKIRSKIRPFGISESDFNLLDGRTKMITKMPIRLISLSMLDLREKSCLWDVGFCTGSVSIEAKLQFPHIQVISFEVREEGRELMASNARKFGALGMEAHIGDFGLMDISAYPKPNAVFIGGHGGKMKEIVNKVSQVIEANGVIVFNAVSEDSFKAFQASVEECNMKLEATMSVTVDQHNTIQIMKAIK